MNLILNMLQVLIAWNVDFRVEAAYPSAQDSKTPDSLLYPSVL